MGEHSAGTLKLALRILLQFYLIVILTIKSSSGNLHSCKVEQCSRKYTHEMESNYIKRGPSFEYCKVLNDYMVCLKETARSCRGSLYYHSTVTLVQQWTTEFNCSIILVEGTPSVTRPTRLPRVQQTCAFHGKHDFRYCSLFGDPHLRTFTNEFQTCKVQGAWPLVDNAYLAVQVTNEPVVDGSSVTATTKVTVIVRDNHPGCAAEKTYEAQVDNVPSAFVDGTVHSGNERAIRIKEKEPGRHIEIYVRYIATTIMIRQTARYLSVAMRMPRDVAFQGSQDGLQLCVRGCPANEQLDNIKVLSNNRGTNDAGYTREEAIAKCKQMNLSGYFLDSCVFDLMESGDLSFRQAAQDAWSDLTALNPHQATNLNKTDHSILNSLPTFNTPTNSVASLNSNVRTSSVLSVLAVLVVIIMQNFR